ERWGTQLKRAGVDSGLSPVADVVPPEIGNANKPIAANNRGYGCDPDEAAAEVVAVVEGLRAGGLGPALEHFPGLGGVPVSTGTAAGMVLVRLAPAAYGRIGPDHGAALSRAVIAEALRDGLGWDGVVVSDDLGVAKAVSHLSPGRRAVGFLRAGGDLVVNVDPASVSAMVEAVVAEASDDDDFAAAVTVKAERVLRMKAGRGLAEGPAG